MHIMTVFRQIASAGSTRRHSRSNKLTSAGATKPPRHCGRSARARGRLGHSTASVTTQRSEGRLRKRSSRAHLEDSEADRAAELVSQVLEHHAHFARPCPPERLHGGVATGLRRHPQLLRLPPMLPGVVAEQRGDVGPLGGRGAAGVHDGPLRGHACSQRVSLRSWEECNPDGSDIVASYGRRCSCSRGRAGRLSATISLAS